MTFSLVRSSSSRVSGGLGSSLFVRRGGVIFLGVIEPVV